MSSTVIGFVVIVGVASLAGLTQRDDEIRFWPTGRETGNITRHHPLKARKSLPVWWARDSAFGEQGWCVWAALPGEKPRYHLVLHADGETIMGTRPEWWRR